MDDLIKLETRIKRLRSRRKDKHADKADRAFSKVRADILERDQMSCRGCGVSTVSTKEHPSGFFEVHHIDDDHHNNDKSNLVLLCPLCHSVFTAGRRGGQVHGDIGFTKVEQRTINRLVHVKNACSALSVMHRRGDPEVFAFWKRMYDRLRGVYDELKDEALARREKIASELFSRRHEFSEMLSAYNHIDQDEFVRELFSAEGVYEGLRALDAKSYRKRNVITRYVRVFPDESKYAEMFAWMGNNVWGKLDERSVREHAAGVVAELIEQTTEAHE